MLEYFENYGGNKKAIDYTAQERTGLEGYVFTIEKDNIIVGAVVVNKTVIDECIPGNILVYITTHKEYRGKGIGEKIMKYAIDNCKGDIALHVEKDNPAKFLYEKLGFTTPYVERRKNIIKITQHSIAFK